jgi:predicted enzyme related to lactoylglutathione lyase
MATARKRKKGAVVVKKKTSARLSGKRKKVEEVVPPPAHVGKIGWLDITVPDGQKLRDFYKRVVGWNAQGIEMGGYEDFLMSPPAGGDAVAGICNSRGVNVGLPNVWLPYFTVADVEASARTVEVLGGRLRTPIRSMGDQGRYVVIEDSGGALSALFQPAPKD